MGRAIIKINDTHRAYYLEWSSVVDAPISRGLTLSELTERVRLEYGEDGVRALPDRLARVEKRGHSLIGSDEASTVAGFISGNRAGADETELSLEQILTHYCHRAGIGKPPPMGKRHRYR